jgi:hypothetical protein
MTILAFPPRESEYPRRMSELEFLDAAALASIPCLVAASPSAIARKAYEIAEAMRVERHLRHDAITRLERAEQ